MRVIFFGTPGCAVPYLPAIEAAGGELVAIVTQPDRARGRSKQPCAPPVKEAAAERQLPVLQPDNCRSDDFISQLRDLAPDLLVVVAFGRILCPRLLEVPRVAALNVHYSLLPAFRGAAPVQHALLAGLAETGVTLQHLANELDAGDVVAQATLAVAEDDNTETLTARLTDLGVRLVVRHLPAVFAGSASRRPQDESRVTLAPRLTKEDGLLDWKEAAAVLANRIRAVTPWPGAAVCDRGRRLLVRSARAVAAETVAEPGTIVALDPATGPLVATGDGNLQLLTVQPPGKQTMAGAEYLRGARLVVGDVYGGGRDCLQAAPAPRQQ